MGRQDPPFNVSAQTHLLNSVSQVLTQANELLEEFGQTMKMRQSEAQITLRDAAIVIGTSSCLIGFVGVMISIGQYHSVVRPLDRLRDGVRRATSGDLDHRVTVEGGREFVDLADDFNQMTTELNTIYKELEQRVVTKSKELVRSERLASVGYLAAGVAHEINNPLNIISGYAEILLKQQGRAGPAASSVDMTEELKIICDESFRCKQIIEKLLSLTRGSSQVRQEVDLASIAHEITSIVRALRKYKGRRVELELATDEPLIVLANEAEMKQVLLNLTINALEAVDPNEGLIRMRGWHDNGYATVDVQDNGCGMSPQTIEKVFEPFFTTRCDQEQQGTGLGLSIVHAIIKDHGGQIEAHSDGRGLGSRFTIRLPNPNPSRDHDRTSTD